MLPIGSNSRRLLNQSTHSSVAYSTVSNDRHGPRRWMTSVLNRPITVSASASDAADRRLDTRLGELLAVFNRDVLGRFKWSSQRLMRSYDDQIEAASLRSFW